MSLRHGSGRAPSAAGKVLLEFARCFARLRTVRDLPDRKLQRCYNDNNAFFERKRQNTRGQSKSQAIPAIRWELAIPWRNLNVTASPGLTIRFDVGNNDDDDGGDYPRKLGGMEWHGHEQ